MNDLNRIAAWAALTCFAAVIIGVLVGAMI
jgi:hypothetical protein